MTMANDTPTPTVASFKPADVAAMSPEARETFAASMERAGYKRADIDSALQQQQPQQTPQVAATQEPTLAQQFDESSLAPAKPDDYQFNAYVGGFRDVDTAELAAFDTATREAFSAAGVPALMGNSLLGDIIKAGDTYEDMPENAKDAYKLEQRSIASKMGDLNTTLRRAQIALARMPASYRAMLDESGILHNANVIVRLSQVGHLIEQRAGMK